MLHTPIALQMPQDIGYIYIYPTILYAGVRLLQEQN